MNNISQGIDIVHISRFREVLMKHPAFAQDIFTEKEINYCMSRRHPHVHFAARFAAKEAGLKAIGIGMPGTGIDHAFREIEVIREQSGRPGLSFSGWVAKLSTKKGFRQCTVSISHSGDYAVASVMLAGPGGIHL